MGPELSEDKAVGNWCQNISLDCVVSPENNKRGESNPTDELLGKSNTTENLPPPTSSSSSMEEPTPLPLPPEPSFPLPSPPEEVDCRVSEGQDCLVSPEGTSPSTVSHHVLVQLVTKAIGAWIVLWQGSPASRHVSRLVTSVSGA